MPTSTRRRTGRPTALTPEVADSIIASITQGNGVEAAAGMARVAESTVYSWLQRGRKARDEADRSGTRPPATERRYTDFLEGVEAARSMAESRMVSAIMRAAEDGKWEAAKFWLQVRYPDRYSLTQTVKHEVTAIERALDEHVEGTERMPGEAEALAELADLDQMLGDEDGQP